MNRRSIKEYGIGILIGLLVFGASHYYVKSTDGFAVKDVEIVSDKTQPSDSVFLSQLNCYGENMLNVDLASVGLALCENYRTESALLRRSPKMKIRVSFDEEIPLFWVQGDRLYAVSRRGRVLKPSEVDRGYDLPVLMGLSNIKFAYGEYAEDNRLNYAAGFLRYLSDYDNYLARRISTIRVDERAGVIITLIPNEVSVIIGFSYYGKRIEKLKSIIAYIDSNGDELSGVDLRHGNMVLFDHNKKKWRTE